MMASQRSKSPSTPSEGEIIESASDTKATTSQTSFNNNHNDTLVNRDTRTDNPPRTSSKSPEPARRLYRRERSRSRSRSRTSTSPPSHRQRPRGEKRRREDDYYYYDGAGGGSRGGPTYSRGLGLRYHDKRYYGRDDSRRRHNRSYYDHDRSGSYERGLPYNDEYDSRSEKRPKTRSRSPFREPRRQRRYSGDAEDSDYRKGRRSSTEQSVSERGKPSIIAQSSKQVAEHRNNQVQQASSTTTITTSAADTSATDNAAPAENGTSNGLFPEPVDEAALIEERRRRREAIKAKYRGTSATLVPGVKKLGIETDSTTRPAENASQGAAGGDSAVGTPDATSGVQSPSDFQVAKDEDLVNTDAQKTSFDKDGPSAADYDPTKDMREDKMRHDKRHFGDELSSSAYDETKPAKQDVLVPEPTAENPSHMKVKNSFDMFAENDYDMFAEEVPVPNKEKAGGSDGPSVAQPQELDMSMMDNWDDPEGYYNVMLGELINSRYHVQQNLGKGMFSSVVRATDSKTGKLVAVKIIRNNDTMRKAGAKEIEILQQLRAADPEDKKHMVRFERQFDHKGHLCMVFENLSMNLREVLKKFGRDVGLNSRAIRAYAQQMFLGLSLLRKCNVLHADLKPDNLLVNDSRNLLKICDLGSASPASESEITPYLVSRFYRAPEIILGIPYDYAIDVWSIGCTLFELYSGKILFTGRTNNQMLRSIMECRGKFPPKLLRRGVLSHLHFDDMLNFRSVEEDKVTGRTVTKVLDFKKPTRDLRTRLTGKGTRLSDAEAKELNLFIDLLDRCLNLNPEKRCTPSEALRHPFIMRAKA